MAGQSLPLLQERGIVTTQKKRIAIIGTGIAGMSAAHKLHRDFELTLYEKNQYVGGHTNTVTVNEDGAEIPIDTGFMVYNEVTYPNLTRLFQELQVATKPTSMSFSVQHLPSGLEFAGTGFRGLFAQSKNLFKPSHWQLLREIHQFNSRCREVLIEDRFQPMTLAEYCAATGLSTHFRDRYLVPMSSAVWSSPPKAMLDFPILTLVRFFSNHRFLGLNGQLAWRTVVGGSRSYRDALIRPFIDRIRLRNSAVQIRRKSAQSVEVLDAQGQVETFAAVLVATHADEALQLLEHPTPSESRLLKRFRYQLNTATLHSDRRVMPQAKDSWASWNYRVDSNSASTVYWMNSLQAVSKRRDYFVSINDPGLVEPSLIHQRIEYHHPLYTLDSVDAQKDLPSLNDNGSIYFCGSYFRYGFHEDALVAGLQAAEKLKERHLK
jgi:predicted NAD/FAD-binding protein